MPIKYDIDKLKSEYVNKTINWLTVIDIYKDSNNHTVCKCKCKCGTVKDYPIKAIRKGLIKSCGCYHKSKEYSDSCKKWCNEHRNEVKLRSDKYKQWCKDNVNKLSEQGARHSEWFSVNTELQEQNRQRMVKLNLDVNRERSKLKRIESIKHIIENENLYSVIHEDDLGRLLSGDIIASEQIRTTCPQCGRFSPHNVRDIFNISKRKLKQLRLCDKCFSEFSSSKYENEIADYISTFYSGECVRNSRSIISPFELDLYYPEKKIAIEFNGDYWHSEDFKSRDYHYSKFKKCLENGIILVNIFESLWLFEKESIKSYLYDLFNCRQNKLSFVDNCYINNNYPPYDIKFNAVNYIESTYKFKDKLVYTAGLSSYK